MNIAGLTWQTSDASFVVHVSCDYDYLFPNKDERLRDELFENLKAAYFLLAKKNLPVYKVPKLNKKSQYTSKDDARKAIMKHPNESFLSESSNLYEMPAGAEHVKFTSDETASQARMSLAKPLTEKTGPDVWGNKGNFVGQN